MVTWNELRTVTFVSPPILTLDLHLCFCLRRLTYSYTCSLYKLLLHSCQLSVCTHRHELRLNLDINLLLYLRNRDVWDRMYQYFCIDPHVSLFVELNNAMFAHLAVTWMLHKNSLCLDNRIFLTKQPCG